LNTDSEKELRGGDERRLRIANLKFEIFEISDWKASRGFVLAVHDTTDDTFVQVAFSLREKSADEREAVIANRVRCIRVGGFAVG
jgi:hypothetical protein